MGLASISQQNIFTVEREYQCKHMIKKWSCEASVVASNERKAPYMYCVDKTATNILE
ncbi:MAG: hypothetical protein L6R39_006170 [Caloplaca ligustica]|nr:MAG: hypothetical protein L6R39_006170 [Caloplaca ligustica]